MAPIAHTLVELREFVYLHLYGPQFSQAEIGDSYINDCINRAYAETVGELGKLAWAGELYAAGAYNVGGDGPDGTRTRFPWVSLAAGATNVVGLNVSVLVPCAIEVAVSGVYQPMNIATAEKLLSMGRTMLSGHYHYAFMGSEAWIRPAPPLAAAVTLHYISVPEVLSLDTDAIKCSFQLFNLIGLKAALKLMPRLPSMTQEKVALIMRELQEEGAKLLGQPMQQQALEYSSRTGVDLKFGGRAPGQGGG